MKTTSYKILHIFFEISFFTFIIIAFVVVCFGIKFLVDDNYEGHYSVSSFESSLFPVCKEEVAEQPGMSQRVNAHLEAGNWHLKLNSRNIRVKGVILGFAFISIAYMFFILCVLRRFVLSLKTDQVFSIDNVRRLRTIGFLILFIEPLLMIARYIMRLWLKNYIVFEFPDNSITYKIDIIGIDSLVWNWLFVGLLILVIAEVFRQGLKMKEEQDLTI